MWYTNRSNQAGKNHILTNKKQTYFCTGRPVAHSLLWDKIERAYNPCKKCAKKHEAEKFIHSIQLELKLTSEQIKLFNNISKTLGFSNFAEFATHTILEEMNKYI